MSTLTQSSPIHGPHPHHHGADGDDCCASPAAAASSSSASLPPSSLDHLTSSPSSSDFYPSLISNNDLPSYKLSERPPPPTLPGGDFDGLSSLGQPQPVQRSLAMDVQWPSREHPLNLGDLRLSDSHEPLAGSLDAFDIPQLSKTKKVEPSHPSTADSGFPRLAFNMDNFSNCLNGLGPPAPPGGYLEPNSHFFTRNEPIVTMQHLCRIMKEKKVDCEVMVGLFRVKCEAYRDCARCEFHVRLFSVDDERGSYAVEFQRRFGDGMVFHNLYAETKRQFDCEQRRAEGSTASPPSPVSASPLRCPPLDMPEMRCCRQVKCDVMKVLIDMCASDCVDVKANAITALAEMSMREEMKEPMLESGVADIFIESLCCTHMDVHRCALTGLANLIGCGRNTRTCQLWMKTEKVKHALCKLSKSNCPQIVRECARSFEYIAETLKEQVRDDVCFKHCVARLLCSQDVETRESALRAQQQLSLVQ